MIILLFALSQGGNAKTPTDNMYFAGPVFSWHERDCFVTIRSDQIQHIAKKRLHTSGLSFGKRFSLPLAFRLQIPCTFEYGTVTECTVDMIPLANSTVQELVLNSVLYNGSLQLLLQRAVQLSSDFSVFIALGAGLHLVKLLEEERIKEKPNVRILDPYLEYGLNRTGSCAVGGGAEIIFSPQYALSCEYQLKFWKPVVRKTSRDLFPRTALPYAEQFFSHTIFFSLLIARGNHL